MKFSAYQKQFIKNKVEEEIYDLRLSVRSFRETLKELEDGIPQEPSGYGDLVTIQDCQKAIVRICEEVRQLEDLLSKTK